MIQQLCTISALVLGTTAFGQAVPNGGFEDWNDMGVYEDPAQWATLNFVSMFGASPTVSRSTDAHEGTYSAKLETIIEDIDGDGLEDSIPGLMFLGNADFLNEIMTEGAPFTDRPDSLTGWTKYLPVVADFGYLEVSLTKWNSTDGLTETIAGGEYMFDEATDWSRFSTPLEYYSEEAPDSVRIFIISNTMVPSDGTTLFVDGLEFVTNSTADAPELHTADLVYYPNPANATLTVIADKNETIEIYNALGKLVATVKAEAAEKTQISTESYRNGVYFLKGANGELHRFVVQH
jgi:hypothetical protein